MLTRQKLLSLRTLLYAMLAIAAGGTTSALAQVGNAANGATAYMERVSGRKLPGLPRLCRDVSRHSLPWRK